jgi:hypothetical protein
LFLYINFIRWVHLFVRVFECVFDRGFDGGLALLLLLLVLVVVVVAGIGYPPLWVLFTRRVLLFDFFVAIRSFVRYT